MMGEELFKDDVPLLSKLYDFAPSKENASLIHGDHSLEAERITVVNKGQKSELEINNMIAEGEKVILLNHTYKVTQDSKTFERGYLFDHPLKEIDLENLTGFPCLFLKQQKITQEGIDYVKRALINLPFVEFKSAP
jgi:hypothetical protein